jgi:exosortase sorting signal-containing protein
LRIIAAAFKAWLGIVALALATSALGQSAGTAGGSPRSAGPASTNVPSIRLLQQQTDLAGTCGGSAFDVNTFIDVDNSASADVKVTAPGVGLIEEFTDETGTNIGPYNAVYSTFHILPFGGGLAPNTIITVTITTYTGPTLSGTAVETSRLAFNCTTGKLAPLGPGLSQPVPTLSDAALAASALLLAALGAIALRRRKARC